MSDAEFRSQFGKLVRQLLDEKEERGERVTTLLLEHLGEGAKELPILLEEFQGWDLPNVQLALDAAFARDGWEHEVVGLTGEHYHGLGLGDLLSGADWIPLVGSPTYVNAPVGPAQTMPCLAYGLVLARSPEGPHALFIHRREHGFG
jgi:hypothetical protein